MTYDIEPMLIVDGRGGITNQAENQSEDPFEHVARLEELLGHALFELTKTVTTTTTTRTTVTLRRIS